MSFAFRALGTTAVVAAVDPERTLDAVALVSAELAVVDRACSRFRADSELLSLPHDEPAPVSSLLADAVGAALDAAAATDGLVDPTVGRTLRLAGYDATFRVVTSRDGERFRARFDAVPGWQVVALDRDALTLCVPGGVELDLGATAKAFAADRCAALAHELLGCGVLVGLGGDIAVAGDAPAGGWPIGIADDHAAGEVQTTVAITTGGLATSSTSVRRWRSGAQSLHHVIDPRSGRPANSRWRTVSVAAGSCLAANVASTATIVLSDDGPAWLEARGVDARLVAVDGAVVTTGRWPVEAHAA
ncbi:MAG TPA: FAD:protein FMN transferase [Gaiellaceae bacterium]|nr:FAD:protein FMN transferase [Gaiellaceae bacterium]